MQLKEADKEGLRQFRFHLAAGSRTEVRVEDAVPIPLSAESLHSYFLMLCATHRVPCFAHQRLPPPPPSPLDCLTEESKRDSQGCARS